MAVDRPPRRAEPVAYLGVVLPWLEQRDRVLVAAADNVIRIGILTPHAARGPEAEFPAMAPGLIDTGVARVMSVDEVGAEASQSVAARTVADPRLVEAAEAFASGGFDAIGFASTSYAYGAGFAAEMAMVSRLSRQVAVPVAATCASCVLALQALRVARIVLVHPPWFGNELNELGAAYFQSQGMHVVSSTSAQLTNDPRRIEAGAVCEWTSRHVSEDAEAVFIGGSGFRAAGAIACLETALGRPVITSNQVLLWNLLALLGAGLRITGYGRLFAHLPLGEAYDQRGGMPRDERSIPEHLSQRQHRTER